MSHCGPLLIYKSVQPPIPAGQLVSTVVRIGCPLVTEHIYTKKEMEIRTLTPKKWFLFSFFELWKWTWWVEFQAQGKGKDRRFRPENVSRSSSPCPLCICQLFFISSLKAAATLPSLRERVKLWGWWEKWGKADMDRFHHLPVWSVCKSALSFESGIWVQRSDPQIV